MHVVKVDFAIGDRYTVCRETVCLQSPIEANATTHQLLAHGLMVRGYIAGVKKSLSLFLSHTHTHMHRHTCQTQLESPEQIKLVSISIDLVKLLVWI